MKGKKLERGGKMEEREESRKEERERNKFNKI